MDKNQDPGPRDKHPGSATLFMWQIGTGTALESIGKSFLPTWLLKKFLYIVAI
jgi:hypothetical protein